MPVSTQESNRLIISEYIRKHITIQEANNIRDTIRSIYFGDNVHTIDHRLNKYSKELLFKYR